MALAVSSRPVAHANCPLRREIMAELPAPAGGKFALQIGVLMLGTGLGTILALQNLETLRYFWILLMELCS